MPKIVSLTLAQYRLLGRAIRGERLPKSRYQPGHASIAALARKNCLQAEHGHWRPTGFGQKVHAARGCLRPGREVYDSATPRERSALGRVSSHWATSDDRDVAEGLAARMRAAGEMPR